jgi:hypothetical protein
MCIGLHVKYRNSCQIFMKVEHSQQIYKQYSNIKFNENPSSASRVFPCGKTAGLTDMTELIIAFYKRARGSEINLRFLESQNGSCSIKSLHSVRAELSVTCDF